MKMRIPSGHRIRKTLPSMWMHFANFFAAMLWTLAILDWRFGGNSDPVLICACLIYCVALAVFCGEKEYGRWHEHHRAAGTGEGYVALWTVLMAILFFAQNGIYQIPPEIVATYIVVIAFFAITEKSKELHVGKKTE